VLLTAPLSTAQALHARNGLEPHLAFIPFGDFGGFAGTFAGNPEPHTGAPDPRATVEALLR